MYRRLNIVIFLTLFLFNITPLFSLKLVSLNIWEGRVPERLIEFVKTHQDIDVFCLQEAYYNAPRKVSDDNQVVHLNILEELASLLPSHRVYFRPVVGKGYGLAIFVRKNIEVLGEGGVKIHDNPHYLGWGPSHSRKLQWMACRLNGHTFYVVNIHGLWNGKGKTDSPPRIVQSKRIRHFVDNIKEPVIICGDFNLRPDTKSLKIIENGMENLIAKYRVTSTRTSYYPKKERFADYIITSSNVKVKKFEVMPDEVSDHAPLLLDFNVSPA